ncbi:MAG: hypothetical protein FWC17_00325 [Treponema sp.]|nr:hypothetical protein [Treponema sp.]
MFSDGSGESGKPGSPVSSPTFTLVLGIMSAVTGILKLLNPVRNGLFFLGDLIPAAAGIVAGLILVFGIYRGDSESSKPGELEKLGATLMAFKKPISFGLMAAALLHFIFAEVIFL